MEPTTHATPVVAIRFEPLAPLTALVRHRRLVVELTKRDVVARYRGSRIGLVWTLLQPLLLLGLYTFVFGTIFRMKWGTEAATHADFATLVFAGLIVHGLAAECIGRAPALVLAHANYVKRVVFPLEVLPWVAVLAALFQTLVNLVVLVVFVAFATGALSWTALLAPLVLLPLILLCAGATWFLASLGVFLRDVGQIVGFVATLLLFLSPIFYPITAVPVEFRPIVEWNPLTPTIEQLRAVTVFGTQPDWTRLAALLVAGMVFAALGHYGFQRWRHAFADVL